MPRFSTVASGAVLVAALSGAVIGPDALARSRASSTGGARAMLEQAFRASVAMQSVHVKGRLTEASTSNGFSISFPIEFHGDATLRGTPAVQLRGSFVSTAFRLETLGDRYAHATANGPFDCGGPVPPPGIDLVSRVYHLARLIVRHAVVVDRGFVRYNGGRAIMLTGTAARKINATYLYGKRSITLPPYLSHSRFTFWIRPHRHIEVGIRGRMVLRQGKVETSITIKATLSRYGERIAIPFPAKCRAA
ncbi:MAG TPA: hypothetical protein VG815_10055 [Chloroflexota bacterium]|jgi:hypothetical protein|nr:hypothetical protein [Chloroflexota bacterium]